MTAYVRNEQNTMEYKFSLAEKLEAPFNHSTAQWGVLFSLAEKLRDQCNRPADETNCHDYMPPFC